MKRLSATVRKKAAKIKLLLLDVDGVMTDGSIVINAKGEEIKFFDVRDGQGIQLLMRAGLQVGFITGRFSKAVTHRARELGVRMVYQRANDKIEAYRNIKERSGLKDGEIAYVGDDIVDSPLFRKVGLAIAVRDCWKQLKRQADYVTSAPGGHGAIREVVELLLKAQRKWTGVTRLFYRN